MKTRVTELLGITYPIIQGGMAWVATHELASAVSNAGGLGIIGAGGAPASWVREQIQAAKKETDKPFGVNLMLMNPEADEIAKVLVEENVKVVTTGAGNPAKYMQMWKDAGIKVIPVVASVALAKLMERGGADAVVAEGTESGGHIGSQTTMTLVPQVVDAVSIPVIAAGGIADGRGFAAALMLGAEAVQMGTRFVVANESIVHEHGASRGDLREVLHDDVLALVVERARDLVAEQDARLCGQCSCDGRALALAAADLERMMRRELLRQFDEGKQFLNAGSALRCCKAAHAQGLCDAPAERAARVERGFRQLKNHLEILETLCCAPARLRGIKCRRADAHNATVCRRETRNDPRCRALSTARNTDKAGTFPRCERKAHIMEHVLPRISFFPRKKCFFKMLDSERRFFSQGQNSLPPPMRGTDAMSSCVYADAGCVKTSSHVPCSTTRPACRTSTRSAIYQATPMWCVTRMSADP